MYKQLFSFVCSARLVELILGDEAPSVDGKLVVSQAFIETGILGHGGVDLQLALHTVVAQPPFVNLGKMYRKIKNNL